MVENHISRALTRFPDLPRQMQALPVDHRGFPIPWFVAWVDGEASFPVADGAKLHTARHENLCWVCGKKLPKMRASVIGPMCAINRTISEPTEERRAAAIIDLAHRYDKIQHLLPAE